MGLIGSILKTTAKIAIGVPLVIAGGMIKSVGDAAKTQRDSQNLSNSELVDRYNNSTGSAKAGYAAEIKRRSDN